LDQQTGAVFEAKFMLPWHFSGAAEKHMASSNLWSNLWAELAAAYLRTRAAHQDHETAKAELRRQSDTASGPNDPGPAPSASMLFKRRTPMHQSSERIGAIAAALAKAQAELTNPEKTLPPPSARPFRARRTARSAMRHWQAASTWFAKL
jgi:hypothetical protein